MDKCLIIAFVFGYSRNLYYKSDKRDKTFLYLKNIDSKFKYKKSQATKLLMSKIEKIMKFLDPHCITNTENTCKLLSKEFKCQFFIFIISSNVLQLSFMYPVTYDDTLQPIYLLQDPRKETHVLSVISLKSLFKTYSTICFACKRNFKTLLNKHMCRKKKNCFACRRFFCTEDTYLHDDLLNDFCDKLVTSEESYNCNVCNVTLYSDHCAKGHKRFCSGKGYFGWKCQKCKKFTYRSGKTSSEEIQRNHICGSRKCKFCLENFDVKDFHICKLRQEKYPKTWPRLAFLGMEHSSDVKGHCWQCFVVKKKFKDVNQLTWKELHEHETFSFLQCPEHMTNVKDSIPILICIYKESNIRGVFDKMSYKSYKSNEKACDDINFDYTSELRIEKKIDDVDAKKEEKMKTFLSTLKTPKAEKKSSDESSESKSALHEFIEDLLSTTWANTTIISYDPQSLNFVSIL
jgi:hypothetical protein